MGGPRVKTVERSSQATPLAQDVLKRLQGELSTGFGTGSGPLQRGAGTAIEKFMSSLQTRSGQPGIDPAGLIKSLTEGSNRNANLQAADLREGFGAAGNRFGTSMATGEGRLRGEIGAGLNTDISNLLFGASQFNAGQKNTMDQTFLQGIAQMFGQGQASMDPFLSLAALGILPPELIVSPGVGEQLLSGLISAGGKAAGAYAGRPS